MDRAGRILLHITSSTTIDLRITDKNTTNSALMREDYFGTRRSGLLALGNTISTDFLKALATAEDLMNQVILEQDLRHLNTGQLLSGKELLGRLGLQIEKSGDLPLLTMTANASEPRQAKEIVESWARLFVENNARLFETEAGRSYEFQLEPYAVPGS